LKLIFQIAAGVILAVVIIVLFRAVPGVLDQERESAARDKIRNLSPYIVISRCGQPLKDTTGIQNTLRYMYYKGAISDLVILTFVQDQRQGSAFISADAALSLDDKAGFDHYATARDTLRAIPCLGEK
jgi:hypothetical protein